MNVLLTGRPGIGKTTIIRQVLGMLGRKAGGFYTREIREGHSRVGFEIVSLDGDRGVLAHINHPSPFRVSKYGVNVGDLERVGVPALTRALSESDLIVMDEIGRMEIFSQKFQQAVVLCLDSKKDVLGTIQDRSSPFLDSVRSRKDVLIYQVTQGNRDVLAVEIAELLATVERI